MSNYKKVTVNNHDSTIASYLLYLYVYQCDLAIGCITLLLCTQLSPRIEGRPFKVKRFLLGEHFYGCVVLNILL